MSDAILDVSELTTKYITRHNENVYAVDHVSLKVEAGKTLGIAGESGCGKSTLALSLMGYYSPPLHYSSGEIVIDGRNISGMDPDDVRKLVLGREIAYIPQSAMNALNPTQKVISIIEDVVQAHDSTVSKKQIYERAKESFKNLGLPEEVLQKYSTELSGGMKQRTVIAISVIMSPIVLIADEPSSALDVTSQKMVIKMLCQLMDHGYIKSLIFITHELPLLYNVTDDIMVMYAGQIVEKGTAKEVVLAAGLKPTHLDWHALRIGGRVDIFDVLLRLAKEYGLALRVAGRSWIEKVQCQGLPTNDYDFLDSYLIDPVNKAAHYAELLHELPVGLSEWAVHPGLDNSELLAIETGGNHIRQTDFDFLISQQAKDIVKEEGIILLDYRALQYVWKGNVSS